MNKKTDHKRNWGAQVEHGVARKDHLGNTNTPEAITRVIVARTVADRVAQPGRWLEPAIGVGNFYLAVLDEAQRQGVDVLDLARRFDGVDIDGQAIEALKGRLRARFGWDQATVDSLPLYCSNLVAFPTPAEGYAVILTNPPYLSPKNWAKDPAEREALIAAWQAQVPHADRRSDLFIYFFHWCHQHLAEGGRSVFLCSDGWLDSDYGRSLRQELTQSPYRLSLVLNWPWKPLFRDDTCPIVTVVDKDSQAADRSTVLDIDDRDPFVEPPAAVHAGSVHQVSTVMTADEVRTWFAEATPNRRSRLVTTPAEYARLEAALADLAPVSTPLKTLASSRSFGWSLLDLDRAGALVEQPGGSGRKDGPTEAPDPAVWEAAHPIFFQKQARVGKPVDYRQVRTRDSMACRMVANGSEVSTKALAQAVRGGVWVSQSIDRFPLVFTPSREEADAPWIGVSKYLHLTPEVPGLSPRDAGLVIAAVLTSTPVLLAIDRHFKEGTRKTLRVNENGYAKEVQRATLMGLPVPDVRRFSAEGLARLVALQEQRGTHSLPRLDAAFADAAYQEIDRLIVTEMGGAEHWPTYQELARALYWRRMRNTLRYGAVD